MAKIYQIYSKHKKDYDVFQVRKCGIESLKNTIEIPDIVEERIAMVYEEILKRFENIKITKVSHEEFKKLTKESKAVVRTGECSPYANIILKSGVVF